MKIAVLTSSYPRFPGDGTAPFVMSISSQLVEQGHDVRVVAPYDPEVKRMDPKGVELHRFRYIWPEKLNIMGHARALRADVSLHPLAFFLLPFYMCAALIKMLIVTQHQNSDLIHVHWVLPNGLIAAFVADWRRIPFIISLHGSDIYLAKKYRVFGAVARFVFLRAAGVTACSKELQQSAIELGASDEPLLLPWGADPDLFSPMRKNQSIREEYGISPDALLIVALGRLVYKKGFENLLSALSIIIEQHSNIQVLLGGDGPLLETLKQQAEALNLLPQVTFTGRIPWNEVPDFLATADIFVLPSVRDKQGNVDGLPTVLLEAMSSGVVVVASDIGGVNLVVDNDVTGLLIRPGDPSMLADALNSLVSSPGKMHAMSEAARQAVENKYNWDTVSNQLADLFQESIWKSKLKPRLGTLYRDEMLKLLNKRINKGRVLDVGCHDGFWLSTINAPFRVGVDLDPLHGVPSLSIVCADGRKLPFERQSFDQVYALDVIEHIQDDRAFADALSQIIKPGGNLFLSTPSIQIKLFPSFLTHWISLKWGHDLRLGYEPDKLIEYFKDDLIVKVRSWNAPAYRFLYLPLRFISSFAPKIAANLVRRIARWDFRHQEGNNGFYLLEGVKPSLPG